MSAKPEKVAGGMLLHAGSAAAVCGDSAAHALNARNFAVGSAQSHDPGLPKLRSQGESPDCGGVYRNNCDSLAPVTHFSVSTGGPVLRRRFQRGSLVAKSGRWYGVFRMDVLQDDGTFRREQRWQPLGLVCEQSKRAAWKAFQPYLDEVNDAAMKLPQKTGVTLADYVGEWRRDVAVNLKGSTMRAAESHLRAHIIPQLGNLRLTEITTKAVQGFVAYLASDRRSRKTVENVLLTLSSLLKTARAWGYACGDFRFADLT